MITFLWRVAGSPKAENAGNKFKDVAADAYYADAVAWAVANGITNGTSEDEFSPEALVNRAQTVTFLWRLAGSVKAELTGTFADVDADAYYNSAVEWALDNEITNGLTETMFGPESECTRGQIVTFLYRYAK